LKLSCNRSICSTQQQGSPHHPWRAIGAHVAERHRLNQVFEGAQSQPAALRQRRQTRRVTGRRSAIVRAQPCPVNRVPYPAAFVSMTPGPSGLDILYKERRQRGASARRCPHNGGSEAHDGRVCQDAKAIDALGSCMPLLADFRRCHAAAGCGCHHPSTINVAGPHDCRSSAPGFRCAVRRRSQAVRRNDNGDTAGGYRQDDA